MGLPIFDLDSSRNGADRQATPRTEYLYATAMYRLTALSYRSQGRGAALAWLIMHTTFA